MKTLILQSTSMLFLATMLFTMVFPSILSFVATLVMLIVAISTAFYILEE